MGWQEQTTRPLHYSLSYPQTYVHHSVKQKVMTIRQSIPLANRCTSYPISFPHSITSLRTTNPHLCSTPFLQYRNDSIFPTSTTHKMTHFHTDLEQPINPGFRKTITNFETDDGPKNHNQLHLLNGVIVPCMLHMMGILFFLRITWAVGVTGWVGTLSYRSFSPPHH